MNLEKTEEYYFDKWNKIKKNTNKDKNLRYFHEREVFYIRLGKNIGFEQNGKGQEFIRPVVVIKKFSKYIFWGIPLSRMTKKGKYYYNFSFLDGVTSSALLSQLKLIDTRRLLNKIGVVDKMDMQEIKKRTINLFK